LPQAKSRAVTLVGYLVLMFPAWWRLGTSSYSRSVVRPDRHVHAERRRVDEARFHHRNMRTCAAATRSAGWRRAINESIEIHEAGNSDEVEDKVFFYEGILNSIPHIRSR
jgi:hypothetical protein